MDQDRIAQLLAQYTPITRSEMDGVKLLDRMDTKYVFNSSELPSALEQMLTEYRVLELDGIGSGSPRRSSEYRSLYFDTAERKHFFDHHNGRTFRSKVRMREYVGSDLFYLEVKRKTGRGRTDKVRIKAERMAETLTAEQLVFVHKASRCDGVLEAVLWNQFSRITLVHHTRPERLTIDLGLHFKHSGGEQHLKGVCVAELKQEHGDQRSPFARLMRSHGIRPAGMSKYCVGMLLINDPHVKHNAFKAVLLRLERMRPAA